MKLTPRAKLDENSYCMLLKKLPDTIFCDFCEKSFDNRYESIIHNAYHIVIPLLKQELHQCHKCLFYFQTIDHLVNHLVKVHNEVITKLKTPNDEENLEDVIVIDDDEDAESQIDNNSWSLAIDKRVSSIVNGHAILDLKEEAKEEYILPDVYYDVKINCNNVNTIEKTLSQTLGNFTFGEREKAQNVFKHNNENNLTNQHFSVKNETICKKDFDIDDGIILENDFNNEIDKKECILKKLELEKGKIEEPNNHDNEVVENFKSVHYDELIARRKTKCQYCKQRFPNKFKKIEHEAGHIRLLKRRVVVCMECDKYIGGPKAHQIHFKKKHPNCTPKPRSYLKSCLICRFKYFSFRKHIGNYHSDFFQSSDLGENSGAVSKYGNISFECFSRPNELAHTNIIEICHICVKFVKLVQGKCTILGVFKQTGVRFKCSKCLKEVFEINLVEKVSLGSSSLVSKLQYENEFSLKKKKGLSNEDRLKNIQMRLKMINKLSRFYTVFYLKSDGKCSVCKSFYQIHGTWIKRKKKLSNKNEKPKMSTEMTIIIEGLKYICLTFNVC